MLTLKKLYPLILISLLLFAEGCSFYKTVSINSYELPDNMNNEFKSVQLMDGENLLLVPQTPQYLQPKDAVVGNIFNNAANIISIDLIKDAVSYDRTLTKEELMNSDSCTIQRLNLLNGRMVIFHAEPPARFYKSANLVTIKDTIGALRIINENDIISAQVLKLDGWKVTGGILAAAAVGTVIVAAILVSKIGKALHGIEIGLNR